MSKEFIAELREAAASFFKGDGGLRDTLEKAADALESKSADQQRIETAADNCEVLRARLARYEDGEGNPLGRAGVTECACGDQYPANSYGAGFMAANNGVCENCDASAPSHGDQVRHMVPSWMASARAFVDRLHLAGWRDHADAQHAGVAGMYDELLAAPSAGSQGGDV